MRFFVFAISLLLYVSNEEQKSFTFLCHDDNCSKPLFHGRASQRFIANDRIKMSAQPQARIDVYGVSKDGEMDYYLVKLNREEKLFPSRMLKGKKEDNKALVEVIRTFPKNYSKNKDNVRMKIEGSTNTQATVSEKHQEATSIVKNISSTKNNKLEIFLEIVLPISAVHPILHENVNLTNVGLHHGSIPIITEYGSKNSKRKEEVEVLSVSDNKNVDNTSTNISFNPVHSSENAYQIVPGVQTNISEHKTLNSAEENGTDDRLKVDTETGDTSNISSESFSVAHLDSHTPTPAPTKSRLSEFVGAGRHPTRKESSTTDKLNNHITLNENVSIYKENADDNSRSFQESQNISHMMKESEKLLDSNDNFPPENSYSNEKENSSLQNSSNEQNISQKRIDYETLNVDSLNLDTNLPHLTSHSEILETSDFGNDSTAQDSHSLLHDSNSSTPADELSMEKSNGLYQSNFDVDNMLPSAIEMSFPKTDSPEHHNEKLKVEISDTAISEDSNSPNTQEAEIEKDISGHCNSEHKDCNPSAESTSDAYSYLSKFFKKISSIFESNIEWLIIYGSSSLIAVLCGAFLCMCNINQYKTKVNELVRLVNYNESKLLVATKEILSLHDELESSKNLKSALSIDPEKKEAIKEAFTKQLKQYQDRNIQLEDTISYLEKELESVSSSALEMHKLLENSLVNQSTSNAALSEVDDLRSIAAKQETVIEDLKNEMDSLLIENQMLKEKSENVKITMKKLETDHNVQLKKYLESSEQLKHLNLSLEKERENNGTIETLYKSEIHLLKSQIEDLQMELKTSEFQLCALKRIIDEKEDLSCDANDYVQLELSNSTLKAMNDELTIQLREEKGARSIVEEHVGTVTKDMNNLKKLYEVCDKERNEAVTKVQVLTEFFKTEISKLQRELEAKEKLLAETEGKDQLLTQKLKSLKDEIKSLKNQNEALKEEIINQEASFKIQLGNAEQKRQEHWFAFRQSDRKYKECQQEAANLRNRILLLESNNQIQDSNGMDSEVPVPPPPPGLLRSVMTSDSLNYSDDILPPSPSPPMFENSHSEYFIPPEPLYSPDERLPPLGSRRVPSPPFAVSADDLVPPPPQPHSYSNRDRNEEYSYSMPYMRTPPLTNRPTQMRSRHKSSPDSPSSGISQESFSMRDNHR